MTIEQLRKVADVTIMDENEGQGIVLLDCQRVY